VVEVEEGTAGSLVVWTAGWVTRRKKARLLFPARAGKSRRADLGRLEVVTVAFVVVVVAVVA
jgi:hypothetical protein